MPRKITDQDRLDALDVRIGETRRSLELLTSKAKAARGELDLLIRDRQRIALDMLGGKPPTRRRSKDAPSVLKRRRRKLEASLPRVETPKKTPATAKIGKTKSAEA